MTSLLTSRRPSGARRAPRNITAHLFLGALIVYFLIPVWWLIVASSKDATGLFAGTNGALWFDKNIDFIGNFRDLFTFNGGIYLRWMGNSLLYSLSGGLGATVLAVLAGYGFAKFKFRGRSFAFALLLGAVMVPVTALVIPTFIMMAGLQLTNTIWAVILPSMLSPFGVYLMRVYIADAVPDELLDAARVDGAGEFRTFVQVALPLMRPAIVTVLLLSIVATWNNYFLPLAMLNDNNLYPVTVGLDLWQGLASGNNGGGFSLWSIIVMGSLVSIIPLIVAFLSLQKYWQGGLSLGSLK
ncbi:ABC transporter permease [Salinibacterium xinjiangense]|uniref:Multiple sugar transport system permease protein n=1 Tax=Salinibacterium xinjiangense TaxID=386302 RepID=A0A2C8YMV3_9MICO|nr:carbohydrate ABC transporter permease [Salinibacterium xinjiangense]GGK97820.1 ABC transporter permease [Salinibacterium xinjiangense]SOE51826.1 multiple sugar transport system permease protein [Salinibacterium xinjiangense]